MTRNSKWVRHFARTTLLAVFLVNSAQAAVFQLGSLVQAGFTSSSAGNWEVAVGDTAGATADTDSLNTYWNNNEDRLLQMEYLKATNTVNVRVYDGATATGAFTQVSYNPTGGAAVAATAMWTLPSSAFFVTATTGPTQATSISLSNISISGISGAVNIIQPIQQTTISATRAIGGPLSTVSQTQDVVFYADTTGSWRLQGTLALSGIQGGGRATGAQLALSLSAAANDAVPEPSTFGLFAIGGSLMIGFAKRRSRPS